MPIIAKLVKIEIHDEVLFHGEGAVAKWTRGLKKEMQFEVHSAAPLNRRTHKFPGNPPVGNLRRKIKTSIATEGDKVIGITTVSGANYTQFVIDGTKTQYKRIPKGQAGGGRFDFAAGGFPLPSNNFGRYRRVQRVRGQKANNFLLTGYNRVALRHSALVGMSGSKGIRRL